MEAPSILIIIMEILLEVEVAILMSSSSVKPTVAAAVEVLACDKRQCFIFGTHLRHVPVPLLSSPGPAARGNSPQTPARHREQTGENAPHKNEHKKVVLQVSQSSIRADKVLSDTLGRCI